MKMEPVSRKRTYNGPVKGSQEAKDRMQRVRETSAKRKQEQPQQQQPQQQQQQPQQQRRMNDATTGRMSGLQNALQYASTPSIYQNPSWFQNN
jgi:hypothetical protein